MTVTTDSPAIKPVTTEVLADKNISRMPVWIRHRLGDAGVFGTTRKIVQSNRLNTVCEEARCPNRGECWNRGTATFMLLGDTCTRACGYCSVKTGRPAGIDTSEPVRVAEAVNSMGLRYVVLTSVNRDDLADGGVSIFADTLRLLRERDKNIGVEFLTPDFYRCQAQAIKKISTVLSELNHDQGKTSLVWGHNVETVPGLYRRVRKGASYERSLELLHKASLIPGVESKTAIMLGLGETHAEVYQVLRDCRDAGVNRIAIGQYLRPSMQHLPVQSYVHPHVFNKYAAAARAMGFGWVKSGPLVRSSYHAEEIQTHGQD
jgi:lipoic acid synthetase